ncbi:uncharacterized protein LOC135111660 [Scylla paramamosain]|uniref:uncharacterized protein LOC135111660 n=1 Tax=Scylla paramamosain TaxID=85552 RepID=UPI0030834553
MHQWKGYFECGWLQDNARQDKAALGLVTPRSLSLFLFAPAQVCGAREPRQQGRSEACTFFHLLPSPRRQQGRLAGWCSCSTDERHFTSVFFTARISSFHVESQALVREGEAATAGNTAVAATWCGALGGTPSTAVVVFTQ